MHISLKKTLLFQATSPNGGWTTKSSLTVVVDANDRNKMISCYAVNQELGETIVETHMISVLCKSIKNFFAENIFWPFFACGQRPNTLELLILFLGILHSIFFISTIYTVKAIDNIDNEARN